MVVKTRIAELSCGEPRVRKCREPTHPRNFGCHVTLSPSFRPHQTVTNVKKNFFLFVWSLQPWFNLVKKSRRYGHLGHPAFYREKTTTKSSFCWLNYNI